MYPLFNPSLVTSGPEVISQSPTQQEKGGCDVQTKINSAQNADSTVGTCVI